MTRLEFSFGLFTYSWKVVITEWNISAWSFILHDEVTELKGNDHEPAVLSL